MSKLTVLVAVVLATGLGVLTWLAFRAPTPRDQIPTPLAVFELNAIDSIVITPAARPPLTVSKGLLPDQWLLVGADGVAWPVDPTRVRALLRLVADLRTSPGAQTHSTSGAAAGALRLSLRHGSDELVGLRIAPGALGGFTRISTLDNAAAARVEAKFAALFDPDGLLTWRQAVALVTGAPAPARISAYSPNATPLLLRRAPAGWSLGAPAPAAAEPAAAQELARALGGLQLARLLDTPSAPAALGLDDPALDVFVESDRAAVGTAGRTVLVQRLTVGASAEATGPARYARVEAWIQDAAAPIASPTQIPTQRTKVWGPQLAVLDMTALAAVNFAPDVYLAPRSFRGATADIEGLTFAPREGPSCSATRGPGGWASDDVLGPDLITLLAQTPAAHSTFADAPSDAATLTVQGPNQTVLAEFRIAPATASAPAAPAAPPAGPAAADAVLIVHEGPVARTYAGPAAQRVARGLALRPAPANPEREPQPMPPGPTSP